jgi:hypothetical protein
MTWTYAEGSHDQSKSLENRRLRAAHVSEPSDGLAKTS